MLEGVDLIPAPCICDGRVENFIKKDGIYEVYIDDAPGAAEFDGVIQAKNIYSPGSRDNIKKGDKVKVFVMFSFGGYDGKILDRLTSEQAYILGTYDEEVIASSRSVNPLAPEGEETIQFIDKATGAGVTVGKNGKVSTSTMSAIGSYYNPFGHGIHENARRVFAQNHQRVITHMGANFCKEYFGMYTGKDDKEKTARGIKPIPDFPVNYRRLVTQSSLPTSWVSTCEGTWAPLIGGNADHEEVKKGRETLYSKIIHHEKNGPPSPASRVTIEMGEPGDNFIMVRIDDVLGVEKTSSSGPGAYPADLSNKFKLKISDTGAFDVRMGGEGAPNPTPNINKFHMSVDSSGKLTVHASGGIEFSHGDADKEISSIEMSPEGGINITAAGGLKVNGQRLVNENFLTWLASNSSNLCQVTAIGGPAPISIPALGQFNIESGLPDVKSGKGYATTGAGTPATKIIKDNDSFKTV